MSETDVVATALARLRSPRGWLISLAVLIVLTGGGVVMGLGNRNDGLAIVSLIFGGLFALMFTKWYIGRRLLGWRLGKLLAEPHRVVWVYRLNVHSKQYGTTSRYVTLGTVEGAQVSFPFRDAEAEAGLAALNARFPNATAGYTKELHAAFASSPASLRRG